MLCSDEILIKQGAEAKIYLSKFCNKDVIIKERFPKSYRHHVLDKFLTQQGLRSEARCIAKCRTAGISAPCIYFVDINQNRIYMEYISNSITVKQYIDKLNSTYDVKSENYKSKIIKLSSMIGEIIFKMHVANMTHGDLTTSNILIKFKNSNIFISDDRIELGSPESLMSTSTININKSCDKMDVSKSNISVREIKSSVDMRPISDTKLSTMNMLLEGFSDKSIDMVSINRLSTISIDMLSYNKLNDESIFSNEHEIVLIDFGLSSTESTAEDKAIDLYVLERALLSTHPQAFFLFAEILKAYSANSNLTKDVINKFNEVRLRGRKRTMVG